MKYLSLLLFAALLFSACKKQERIPDFKEEIVRQNSGTITADMNGVFWDYPKAVIASYSRVADNRFNINVYLFKGEAWDASLDISDIRLNEAQSVINPLFFYEPVDSLRPCVGSFANIAGGDAFENTYQVLQDSSTKNFVNIDHYDSAAGTITGSFQVTYYKVSGRTIDGYADTLRFTNGKFNLKLSHL